MDDPGPRATEDLARQVRLVLGDGQRPQGRPAEADLVPVVPPRLPAVVTRRRIERGPQPLLDDGPPDGRARVFAERVVQPVVTEGQRRRHLAHVQEVGGIPVGEGGGREHLALGASRERSLTGRAIGEGKRQHALQRCPRDAEQPTAHLPPLHGRLVEDRPGRSLDETHQPAEPRVGAALLGDPRPRVRVDDEAGVVRLGAPAAPEKARTHARATAAGTPRTTPRPSTRPSLYLVD